ncbi:MAG TPA: WbqC family protein [Bacteroidia bacterium]|nr:WbqC family protein [Bacteroidia bacterium]
MKVAVMQPYAFPYIGYLQLVAAVDRFVFLDDVAYINKGWINRNRVLVNDKEHLFTLPLSGASQNRTIHTIELLGDGKWKTKFLRTIEMAYRKAPAFAEVFPLITEMVMHNEVMLAKYIEQGFRILNERLGIKTELTSSSQLDPGSLLKAQDRIIHLCTLSSATMYINPIGGTELYSADAFEKAGMRLQFLKTDPIEYPQGNAEFVPWLSVIDVLMYNGIDGVKEMLGKYRLI